MTATATNITFDYTGLGAGFTFNSTTFSIPLSGPGLYSISPGSQPTLTNGGTTWTFTQFYIAANGANSFCAVLGTASVTSNACAGFTFPGGGANASQGQIITSFFNPGGLPSGAGSFTNTNQSFSGFNAANGFSSTTGAATVTITPEPTSLSFIGAGLLIGGYLQRRRLLNR